MVGAAAVVIVAWALAGARKQANPLAHRPARSFAPVGACARVCGLRVCVYACTFVRARRVCGRAEGGWTDGTGG